MPGDGVKARLLDATEKPTPPPTPTPLHLAWRDLTVEVDADASSSSWLRPCRRARPGSSRVILDGAAGALAPGELVAVLGASGSGKTTLLTALARLAAAEGRAVQLVAQDDLFLPNITAREHLRFHARLRLPREARAACEARADALLAEMGLANCARTLIGAAGAGAAARGISGGERKRLSVATALLAEPMLILADEPTSGLDSFAAEAVVRRLRALSSAGRSCLCTIHAPSSHVLALFDRVLLLADGVTAFDGPVGAALAHFAALGHPCPPLTNPADHFLRILSPAGHEEAGDGAARARKLALAWSAGGKRPGAPDDRAAAEAAPPPSPPRARAAPPAGFLLQLAVLLERNAVSNSRDPVLFYTRVAQTTIVSLLAGAVFFQLGRAQDQVMSRTGAVFFVLVNQALAAIIGVLQTFPIERAVVQREHVGGAYGITAYFLAKSIASLPFELVFPFTFSTVCFFMMRLRAESSAAQLVATWLQFSSISLLSSSVATSMGLWISCAAPNVSVALALAPVVLMPFLLFSGFLLNVKTVAPAFSPLLYTSLFKYAFSAMMTTIWGGGVANDCGKLPAFLCPFPDGASVLRWFALEDASVAADLAALAELALGWRLLAYVTLLWRSSRE